MKMSKSIKDYKDAMDNIKISESFYKRTEVMLSDLSDMELERKPVYSGRRITAFVMTAAACLACVIGVKVMVDSRRSSIVTDETGITEILTSETTETFVTLPIIDDLDGGGDDNMLVDADDVNALSEVGTDSAAGLNVSDKETEEITRAQSEKQPDVAEHKDTASTENAAAPAADTENGNQGNAPAAGGIVNNNEKDTDQTAENESIGEDSDEEPPVDDPVDDYDTVPTENGAAVFPELRATAAESITVEVTPYFNMGNVKSGEGAVKHSGAECADIINSIADISENSHEMGSYSFKSVFSVQIYDENYDETYYSIYVTDLNAIIINKHSANGQSRETYGVQEDEYEALLHSLFLLFGSEDDYELFGTLISGK